MVGCDPVYLALTCLLAALPLPISWESLEVPPILNLGHASRGACMSIISR